MGGEKLRVPLKAACAMGSPPHGRGKGQDTLYVRDRYRITPAWAGKRAGGAMKSPRNRDHPRVGGEKLARLYSSVPVPGSPPRGQGKGRRIVPNVEGLRITPAWAGKSLFCFTAAVPIQDHPRMGGEKRRTVQYPRRCVGSPPRGRGKVADGLLAGACPGITPA